MIRVALHLKTLEPLWSFVTTACFADLRTLPHVVAHLLRVDFLKTLFHFYQVESGLFPVSYVY